MACTVNLGDPTLLRGQAYVDGQWIDARNGESFAVVNPATDEVLGRVAKLGDLEARRAIEAAAAAWPAWRTRSAEDRGGFLKRWHAAVLEAAEDLARLVTAEQGKPLAEARGEVQYAASYIEFYAEEAKRIQGRTLESPLQDRRLLVLREPVGVCAAITPWNFPLAMITRKVAPALAAGNPMIVKPAEATPLSALALAVLAERCGVPPGVLQVVAGDPRTIGAEFTRHPAVRKLSFTGSTAVGQMLYAQSGATVKKLSLELGGNAPFIVFDDADLDAAVQGAMASKYRNSGQTCVCVNRFFVHDSVYEQFAARLAEAVGSLRVGNGADEGVTQGPLINEAAVIKVEAHVNDALERGAQLLAGGHRHSLRGMFFEPTVLADVDPSMRVAREETFGPVAALLRFRSDDEVIEMANATDAGLASYFYSRDVGRIWRVAEALQYGMVGVNTGMISTAVAPFGGIKHSGFGREGSHLGLEDYLVTKYVAMAGI
jgi:succinate-semialdehyde dehydrogenase/glutarate-semialdehyde dehydrogenase